MMVIKDVLSSLSPNKKIQSVPGYSNVLRWHYVLPGYRFRAQYHVLSNFIIFLDFWSLYFENIVYLKMDMSRNPQGKLVKDVLSHV